MLVQAAHDFARIARARALRRASLGWFGEGGRGGKGLAPFQKLAMPLTLAVGLVSPPVEPGSWLSDTIALFARAQRMRVG